MTRHVIGCALMLTVAATIGLTAYGTATRQPMQTSKTLASDYSVSTTQDDEGWCYGRCG